MSKSPSLRRIQADIRELAIDPSDRYHAAPLEDDMFEWHFTIRGADGTEFEGGVYHGRILLPADYPFKPPHIVFLTPSGRFETGTKICLSFSAHHPELWQPAWGIRLILEALISFLPTPADGAIGALDWTKEERKRLAKKSVEYCCPRCGNIAALLPKLREGAPAKGSTSKFQKEIERLHMLQMANESKNKKKESDSSDTDASSSTKKTVEGGESGKESLDSAEATGGGELKIDGDRPEDAAKIKESSEAAKKEESTEKQPSATKQPEKKPPAAENGNVQTEQQQGSSDGEIDRGATHPRLLEPPQVAQNIRGQNEQSMPPWFTDPVVHGIIVCFAALCVLLFRKWQALLEELRSLET